MSDYNNIEYFHFNSCSVAVLLDAISVLDDLMELAFWYYWITVPFHIALNFCSLILEAMTNLKGHENKILYSTE